MNARPDVYLLLLRKERILCRITDSQKACEFISRRSTDNFFDFVRFVGNGDMKYGTETLVCSGKQHILNGAPG